MSSKRIRKAVFPVAGLGTRFLPATKASPKEMLAIVDKPIIQYAVEEAVAAGVEVLVFVTSRTKRSIEDHFDSAYELETELTRRGKTAELELVQSIVPPHVSCVYIRQAEALGLGHAVLCAEAAIGDEPFFVILADDLIDGSRGSALQQMVGEYEKHHSSMVGIERVNPDQTQRYGIIRPKEAGPRQHQVTEIVEKPKPDMAPSNLAVVGRYILTPRIFELLKTTGRGTGGEIQLTDGIAALLQHEKVFGYEFEGTRYDCGNKLGFLRATVEFGLKHDEFGDEFRNYLKKIASDIASGTR
jgi:UTP--glucose-1-phosphate uridylyltransferase